MTSSTGAYPIPKSAAGYIGVPGVGVGRLGAEVGAALLCCAATATTGVSFRPNALSNLFNMDDMMHVQSHQSRPIKTAKSRYKTFGLRVCKRQLIFTYWIDKNKKARKQRASKGMFGGTRQPNRFSAKTSRC